MNQFEIILKGGLKSCCSTYSATELNELIKSWFASREDIQLTVKDIDKDDWQAGEIAEYGMQQFGDRIFPFTTLNGKMVLAGFFPEKKDLLESLENPRAISKADIRKAKEMMEKDKVEKNQ